MRRVPGPFAVKLREIPEEGVTKSYDLTGTFAKKALEETPEVKVGRLSTEVDLTRVDNDVIAHGRLAGELELMCSRCAGPARHTLDAEFDMTFMPPGQTAETPGGGEVEIDAGVADVKHHDHEEIDLEETLREEILLALPLAPVCQESCKGLCAQCGKDLNEGPCGCTPVPADIRWAVLKDVKP